MNLKTTFITILIYSLILGCVPESGGGRSKSSSNSSVTSETDGTGGNAGDGQNATDGSDDSSSTNSTPVVELTHIIDPYDGNYKSKSTIPKNYRGFLYLSGINLSTLNDQFLSVRIRFGLSEHPIVVPAFISRAPGIVPSTGIEVLVLDFSSRPVDDLALFYDLYDYNSYGAGDVPTLNPLDDKLYCRGLKLQHDPTFAGASAASACTGATDECLYSYAKVKDKGLFDIAAGIPLLPSQRTIAVDSNVYANESEASLIKKCLADDGVQTHTLGLNIVHNTDDFTGNSYGNMTSNGKYRYEGPYLPIDTSGWSLSSSAIFNTNGKGLFKSQIDNTNETTAVNSGINSLMFPLAGSYNNFPNNIEFVGTTTGAAVNYSDAKTVMTSASSNFMVDGCNIRVSTKNNLDETVGSCNVSASMEIGTGSTPETFQRLNDVLSYKVKLQVIRETSIHYTYNNNNTGEDQSEILSGNFQTCDATNVNSGCGTDECCFNGRCWSDEIVSCADSGVVQGLKPIGDTCGTDYDCATLCCDQATNQCAAHDPQNPDTPVSCGKRIGEKCISKEFCQEVEVLTWVKVRVTLPDGTQSCQLRSKNERINADCVSGLCKQPSLPTIPSMGDDPNNPDCSDAVDPSTLNN